MKRRIHVRFARVAGHTVPGNRAFCNQCGRDVEVLSVAEAAALLDVHPNAVDRMMAAGHVHAIRLVTGGALICRNSLFAR